MGRLRSPAWLHTRGGGNDHDQVHIKSDQLIREFLNAFGMSLRVPTLNDQVASASAMSFFCRLTWGFT
jgi:hypothetical protein